MKFTKTMNLEGRYLKVLDDGGKTHYPCIKGKYMLFKEYMGSCEYWGDKKCNYFGIEVHKNEDFLLMPEGFHPDYEENINYEIY